jgi:hypothetical protein
MAQGFQAGPGTEDDSDGVQYDPFHSRSAAEIEAEEIRREVAADEAARGTRQATSGAAAAGQS